MADDRKNNSEQKKPKQTTRTKTVAKTKPTPKKVSKGTPKVASKTVTKKSPSTKTAVKKPTATSAKKTTAKTSTPKTPTKASSGSVQKTEAKTKAKAKVTTEKKQAAKTVDKKTTAGLSKADREKEQEKEKIKQVQTVQGYYKLHAFIYDLTRWTFLFGREKLLRLLPFQESDTLEILEIGCGTGKNLSALAKKFPNAHLTAFEVSQDMLKVTRKKMKPYQNRLTLIESPYSKKSRLAQKYDLVLFSYSLTMINPQYAELIEQAKRDLKKGGVVAVVDFHDTPSKLYRDYMVLNHVKMEGHLLPVLEENFTTETKEIGKGYLGVWRYLVYLGRKK